MVLSKRNIAIDVIKGISILLVVYGHAPLLTEKNIGILPSFRMPLFFFALGLFAKMDIPLKEVFKTKFTQLLKPYFITTFLVALLLPRNKSIFYEIASVLYGSQNTLRWLQLWFLSHAFLLFMTASLVHRFYTNFFKTDINLILFLFLICILSAYDFEISYHIHLYGDYHFSDIGFPFSFDRLPASLLFFFCGYFTKEAAIDFKRNYFLCFSGVALIIFGHHIYPDLKSIVIFNTTNIHAIIISLSSAIIGIYILWHIAHIIAEYMKTLTAILSYIGKRSLWILIFHLSPQYNLSAFLETKIDNIFLITLISYICAVGISLLIEFLYRIISHYAAHKIKAFQMK